MGKGGSGKSTLGGLLCLELRRGGDRVVALDGDTVPGLAQVLGMEAGDGWDLAGQARREVGSWTLQGTPAEVVERCSREAPGGIRFVQTGNVDSTLRDMELRRDSYMDRWTGTVAFNTVSRQFDVDGGWAVVDLQGGTLQVAGGLVGRKGVALMVVEPFAKSVLTARRVAEMKPWPEGLRLAAVANKVSAPDEADYVESELARFGVPVWVTVPRDPQVRRAEREGRFLATLDESAPARVAVAELARRLREEAASTPSTNPTPVG